MFASWPTASMIRRQTALAVVITGLREFVDPSSAFHLGVVAVAFAPPSPAAKLPAPTTSIMVFGSRAAVIEAPCLGD